MFRNFKAGVLPCAWNWMLQKTELIWFDRKKPQDDNQLRYRLLRCALRSCAWPRSYIWPWSNNDQPLHFYRQSLLFHLRRIRQVKKCLNEHCLRILVQALVISRLDYCNTVLAGLPSTTLQPLTAVLHSAARLVKDLGPRDPITPSMRQPTGFLSRQLKNLSTNVQHIQWFFATLHVISIVTLCTSLSSRQSLRSASKGAFACLRSRLQFGNRVFSITGPVEWNKLPDAVRRSTSVVQFQSRLKTHFFQIFYDWH